MGKVNTAAIREWADALRSGEYRQGTEQLGRVVDGVAEHCCLGVACELFADRVDVGRTVTNGAILFGTEDMVLPEMIRDYLGLNDCNPSVYVGLDFHTLAELNDNGSTFADIAALIEDSYLTGGRS